MGSLNILNTNDTDDSIWSLAISDISDGTDRILDSPHSVVQRFFCTEEIRWNSRHAHTLLVAFMGPMVSSCRTYKSGRWHHLGTHHDQITTQDPGTLTYLSGRAGGWSVGRMPSLTLQVDAH